MRKIILISLLSVSFFSCDRVCVTCTYGGTYIKEVKKCASTKEEAETKARAEFTEKEKFDVISFQCEENK